MAPQFVVCEMESKLDKNTSGEVGPRGCQDLGSRGVTSRHHL